MPTAPAKRLLLLATLLGLPLLLACTSPSPSLTPTATKGHYPDHLRLTPHGPDRQARQR